MNLAITPRVTYEGEIVLDLSVENNAIGPPVDVGGQSALSFTSRKVHTFLRLREGEANLLAGPDQTGQFDQSAGPARPLAHSRDPEAVLRAMWSTIKDTDIVMLITPHIVRGHELTKEDVGTSTSGRRGMSA